MKKLIITLAIILTSHQVSYSQSFTPSLSFRTANITGKPLDFEAAATLLDKGRYKIYFEVERENGRPFRLWDAKANWRNFYTSYFEKTSKGISNFEVGYLFKRKNFPITTGVTLVYDQFWKVHYMGQTVLEYRSLRARYVKGRKKTIWEGTFDWTVPVRERLVKVGGIEVGLGINLLGKYYKDDKREYWQAKVSVALQLKRGETNDTTKG